VIVALSCSIGVTDACACPASLRCTIASASTAAVPFGMMIPYRFSAAVFPWMIFPTSSPAIPKSMCRARARSAVTPMYLNATAALPLARSSFVNASVVSTFVNPSFSKRRFRRATHGSTARIDSLFARSCASS
jgi:hypothetical protein